MKRSWFIPRRTGIGAAPSTWEGWLSTLVFLAAMATVPHLVAMRFADPTQGRVAALLTALALLAAFIGVCALKTEGGLRWRRGGQG